MIQTLMRQAERQFTMTLLMFLLLGALLAGVVAWILWPSAGAAEAAKARAEAAESRARDLEAEAAKLRMAIAASGQRAAQIQSELEKEDGRFKVEMERLGQPVDDPCVRVWFLCDYLRRAGHLKATEPCECSQEGGG